MFWAYAGGEDITKYNLYKYTADSDHEPDNYYRYAGEHGTCAIIWSYNDLMQALLAMGNFESTCKPVVRDDKSCYEVICYALEQEEV